MDIKKLSQKEIIELIEGDGKIMDFRIKYDNLPVWPLIRAHALAAIDGYIHCENEEIVKQRENLIHEINKKITRLKFLITICIKSKIYNRGKLKKRDVLVFPHRNFLRNGKVHENIVGFFITNRDNTLLMKYYDDKYRWYETEADALFREGLFSIAYIFDDIIGRKKNRHDRIVAKEIVNYIENKIGIKNIKLEKAILDRVSMLSNYVKQRERVLEKVSKETCPRYVIMDEAGWSYYAAECHFFRKKGIPVFEIAHSMMYEGYRSYWFANGCFYSDEYSLFLPSMLVVWSEFSKTFPRVNTRIESVGNPEFYYSLKNDYLNAKNRRKDTNVRKILFNVSTPPYDAKEVEEFINAFIHYNDNKTKLVIRFHPLCRYLQSNCEKYTYHGNVVIDDSANIYEALGKCDYLISGFSTIVYEALACGVRVFTDKRDSYEGQDIIDEVEVFNNIGDLLNKADNIKQMSRNKDYGVMYFGEQFDNVDLFNLYIKDGQW